ncbi:MAG: TM2 domain-containing protein [Saprospiraceae bacterium]
MKRIFQISLMVLLLISVSTTSFAIVNGTATTEAKYEVNIPGVEGLNAEQFLNLTPKQVKELTGKKLTLKETVALKLAQKKIKKEMRKADAAGAPKSQLTALLLAVFIGALGIHRFYLGYTTIGIIQLLTLGGCGIWALIDLIRIITGDLKPADGSDYNPTL